LGVQHLVQNGQLTVNDQLVDANNRVLEETISLDVQYFSPDGKVGNWESTGDFQAPLSTDTLINIDDDYDEPQDEPIFLDTREGDGVIGEDTASANVLLEKMFEGKRSDLSFQKWNYIALKTLRCV
jgi:hypothetical protein